MQPDRINADFDARVVVDTAELPWVPSPQKGVDRRMLDRIGGEVARATSVVRYAPASAFPEHGHALGEEFLVLDGVFSDEHGDYPAGTYVRNPPGSSHSPRTDPGCTILVKLRQMTEAETARVVVDTAGGGWLPGAGPGHAVQPLFAGHGETVRLERLDPGAAAPAEAVAGGEEVFVLSGDLLDAGRSHRAGTWIRDPAGRGGLRSTGGALFWTKRGHLSGA